MVKLLSAAGALLAASLAIPYGATYQMVTPNPLRVGNTELSPGAYWVTHQGKEAIFTNVGNGAQYQAYALEETPAPRNQALKVVITTRNGVERIQSMELGGRDAAHLSFGK